MAAHRHPGGRTSGRGNIKPPATVATKHNGTFITEGPRTTRTGNHADREKGERGIADALASFAALNIGPGLTFDAEQIPGDRQARWQEMLTALPAKLAAASQQYTVQLGNWKYPGPPAGEFGTAYAYRAAVALEGIGVNLVEEAIYPKASADEKGDALSGEKTYTIHSDTLPPILEDGFWSVTAYGSDNFLIDNPLNRYCINDHSEVTYNEDGSLDIILSATQPENVANWLPVSTDEFHLYMRIYYPDLQALSTWEAPTIQAQ